MFSHEPRTRHLRLLALARWLSCFCRRQAGTRRRRPTGPGFFPFGAAIAIGAIASLRWLRTRSQKPSIILATSESEWRKIACVIFGMAAYALLLEPLGFALCTFLLMLFYLKVIALQRWQLSLGFALAVALLAHLFFDLLLNAQLPRGILMSFL
ncbi:MAG TPA: tripartite tricarboxylate transporter TctB family protein [Candidatus Binatus sp.]|nr:tripartite tricarboxylate transporter TctB family protein [Candidatus Binatus sp.]